MLHNLTFEVSFPSTGRTISGDHSFQEGVTLISGANETGKSLRLEMVRYALFGTAALRATSSEYKNLNVALTFDVRGETYHVVRNGNGTKCQVQKDGKILVKGTKPVNSHIRALLGYDLAVFDIANACLQGQVESLSEMKPADRKAMVDQTIGLNLLDSVIKEVAEKASIAAKMVQGLTASLPHVPDEPTSPEGYRPAAELMAESSEAEEKARQLLTVRGRLQIPLSQIPVEPSCQITETAQELGNSQTQRQDFLVRRHRLQDLVDGVDDSLPSYTETELQAFEQQARDHEQYVRYTALLDSVPDGLTTREDIETTLENLQAHRNTHKIQDLRRRLGLSRKLECPKCHHSWPEDQKYIYDLEQQIMDLGPEVCPALDEQTIQGMERSCKEARLLLLELQKFPDVKKVKPCKVDQRTIDRCRDQLRRLKGKTLDQLRDELSQIVIPRDRSSDLRERIQYESALRHFQAATEAWKNDILRRAEDEKLEKQLAGSDVAAEKLRAQYELSLRYENDYRIFSSAKSAYEKQAEQLKEHEELSDQYTKARKALKELKTDVKQFLVPSLNKVASQLINRMTGGERNVIKVDEDFNIEIDDQPIQTLSGSAKAVANLAIRIGLGQVLTNKVFSVFLGDEIDASMDQARSEYTLQCLTNLKSSISQIILVSHKELEAEHKVTLDDSNGA